MATKKNSQIKVILDTMRQLQVCVCRNHAYIQRECNALFVVGGYRGHANGKPSTEYDRAVTVPWKFGRKQGLLDGKNDAKIWNEQKRCRDVVLVVNL